MTLTLKNTYSKQLEKFLPRDPAGQVTLYSCGPTVYSHNHIGNFRSFLLGDVLRRVLEQHGYSVRHVMNITDVGHMTEDHLADSLGEDKLAKAARELGWNPYQVAAHFERSFFDDARAR
jgi:cysteinyl-tRNA synthetase